MVRSDLTVCRRKALTPSPTPVAYGHRSGGPDLPAPPAPPLLFAERTGEILRCPYVPCGSVVGTPAQIADHIEAWVDAGASDGFLLAPALFPHDLDDFVDLVVPELQARGRFRTEYTGSTLREHLGVARPTSPWVAAR